MSCCNNQKGSVLVFITLMIVLLMVMVGMGLDTGQLTYVRAQGQAAVDAAALAAVSGLPEAKFKNDSSYVTSRAGAFNSKNDYVESKANPIGSANVSYVQYDYVTNTISKYGATLAEANGVRVGLEKDAGTGITTPVFLTPLLNLFGASASGTHDVNVSAVATLVGKPSIPIAVWSSECAGSTTMPNVQLRQQNPGQQTENSCWTTYLDKSSGASDIKALFDASEMCQGLPEDANGAPITVGTPIYENKGQVQSVYKTADDFFFKNSTTKNRCWLVPVINGSGNCNAKDPQPIVDWAKICPNAIFENGSHSYIQVDLTCNQSLTSAENNLCFSNRLVREPSKGY